MHHATRAHALARSRMGRCTRPTAQYMGRGLIGMTARRRTTARPLATAPPHTRRSHASHLRRMRFRTLARYLYTLVPNAMRLAIEPHCPLALTHTHT
jgi:hypothetical protein